MYVIALYLNPRTPGITKVSSGLSISLRTKDQKSPLVNYRPKVGTNEVHINKCPLLQTRWTQDAADAGDAGMANSANGAEAEIGIHKAQFTYIAQL